MAAAAETLPDTYAAVVRGTRADVDAVLEQMREYNPKAPAASTSTSGIAFTAPCERIMLPF